MASITAERQILTLINVFTVKPEHQQLLLDILIEVDQSVMMHLPGYISASFHRSFDGTKVTNYAQWESREALEGMLKSPEAAPHLHAVRELAEKFEPIRCEVVYSAESALLHSL